MERPSPLAWASKHLYRGLIYLYPVAFRKRFADQMVEDFLDLYRERCRSRGVLGPWFAWTRVIVDGLRSIPAEHRASHLRRVHRSGDIRGIRGGGRGGVEMMGDLISEIRYGVRSLSRNPAFALVAVVTLALAIGANTLLFSVVDRVLIRPLPYPDADRLVELGETREGGTGARGQVSYPNFTDWRDRARSIDGMGAMTLTSGNLTGSAEPTPPG